MGSSVERERWKKRVKERFFGCIEELINKNELKSQAEVARSLEISAANLVDFKGGRRFITPWMLHLAELKLGISAAYILSGKGLPFLKKHLNDELKSQDEYEQVIEINQKPWHQKEALISASYRKRNYLRTIPSINPNSFSKVDCILDQLQISKYLSYRSDAKVVKDETIYLNVNDKDHLVVSASDNFTSVLAEKYVAIKLCEDPFWIWPDPTYLYILCYDEHSYTVACLYNHPDVNYLYLQHPGKNVLDEKSRGEFCSIWRLEFFFN